MLPFTRTDEAVGIFETDSQKIIAKEEFDPSSALILTTNNNNNNNTLNQNA